MRVLLQRVHEARVEVDGETVGTIGPGLVLLWCAMQGDTDAELEYLVSKIAGLRVFPDNDDKMNRSIIDVGGAVLLVSQFTLAADTRNGRRPSFVDAASPDEARVWVARAVECFRALGLTVETGQFGAMMDVHLVNHGPVTIWLDSRDR